MHDESRGLGVWQLIVSRAPSHLQTKKILLQPYVVISDGAQSRVSNMDRHFRIRRAFIDHKRHVKPIKSFALSSFSWSDPFCDLFYAVLLSWNSYVYCKMTINIFVYRGRGICQQKWPAGPGIFQFFFSGFAPGGDARSWNWLAHKF